MEENTQHFCHIMLYYFKNGTNTSETQKKDLCSVWRKCCCWSNVSKVVCEVSCWRFSLDNVPQLGRPVEVDSDQIKTLIENNQHSITWETADIVKISKSIKLLVKMKNISFILWKKLNRLFVQPSTWTDY